MPRTELPRHPSLDDREDPAYRIVEYDPSWALEAEREIERLRAGLGEVAVRIEHIGSTAVPGMLAKPIVDVQLSVASLDPLELYRDPLDDLGYTFIPDPLRPDYLFFARPLKRPRSHHLHVCCAGGLEELRHLAVRDFLRAHPAEATRYGEVKRNVALREPDDRIAYIQGKDAYVKDLQDRAVAWAEAPGAP